jgi:2-oxo-4-hydroxy-4-carboxy-5-ureidoimidazoline decarboxylase
MPAATQARISLAELNAMSREKFVRHFGSVLEHSPHFAERAFDARPFTSFDGLYGAFAREMDRASEDEQLVLLRAHPDLANRLERLTMSSTREQTSAGLDALSAEELGEFQCLNTAYRERFGFPFIICARLNSKDAILTSFRVRLENSRDAEFKTALAEVAKIARLRLQDLVDV